MHQAKRNKWKYSTFSSGAGHACLHPMHHSGGFKSSFKSPGGWTGICPHSQGPSESGKASVCDSAYILSWRTPISYNFVGRLPMGKNFTDERAVSYTILSFYISRMGQTIWCHIKLSASNYSQSPWLFLHKGPELNSPWKGNRAWIPTWKQPRTQDVCNPKF